MLLSTFAELQAWVQEAPGLHRQAGDRQACSCGWEDGVGIWRGTWESHFNGAILDELGEVLPSRTDDPVEGTLSLSEDAERAWDRLHRRAAACLGCDWESVPSVG